jgi:Tfp pilus assembly protein PilV
MSPATAGAEGSGRALPARRGGVGLAEVIVALVIFSAGIMALAATAAVAHRALNGAAAEERAVRSATTMLDSLLRVPAPQAGTVTQPGMTLAWTFDAFELYDVILVEATFLQGGAARSVSLASARSRVPTSPAQ